MSQGSKKSWPDSNSNPGSLAYLASTLPTKLPSRPLTISPCLSRLVPESARNNGGTNETCTLMLVILAVNPLWAIKRYRGGKKSWPDRDSNRAPRLRAKTLPTELPSHLVDLWHKHSPLFVWRAHFILIVFNLTNLTITPGKLSQVPPRRYWLKVWQASGAARDCRKLDNKSWVFVFHDKMWNDQGLYWKS